MVPVVVATAGVLRMLAVIGQQAFVYVDSIDYETLDFSGRSRRPWVTPLLYSLTDRPALRIVLQAAIGAACWSYLAVAASDLVTDRRVRWAIVLAIVCLSPTTTVTNWDTAMLSESLALSFSALLLGALLRVAQRRTLAAVAVAVAVWVLWIFTRESHLAVGWLAIGMLAVLLAVGVVRTRSLDRVLGALLAGLVAVSLVAALSYGRNTEIVDFNLATVLGNRVLTDPEDAAWFVARGMPLPTSVAVGAAASPEQLLADPGFERWISAHGVRTYLWFLVTHPWTTLTGPLEDLVGDRAPFADPVRRDEVLLAGPDSYGVGRQVIPEPIEDLLFQPGSAGTIVFAMVVLLVLTDRRLRIHGPDPRWLVPFMTVALGWAALTVVWHASVAELGRLGLPSAVLIRVALILQLGLLVDVWLEDRRAAGLVESP